MVKIYALTCLVTGKAYIGCTAGPLAKRFREHRCLLSNGLHKEPDLLADWLLYGAANFMIEEVYVMEEDASLHTKRAMEKHAMARYKAAGLLYNRNEACFQPTPEAIAKGIPNAAAYNRGRSPSPESNLKRRLAQLGKPKNNGAKISATKKALGQRPTLEAARKGGLAAKRRN